MTALLVTASSCVTVCCLCGVEGRGVPSAEMLTIGGVMGETTDLGTVTTLGWGWLQGRWDVNPALRGDWIRYISTV